MKTSVFAALLLSSVLAVGSASAQPAPFNEAGVTMGHWHLISKDVEANKKLFQGMGGKVYMPGGNPLMMFPGVYINLNLGQEKGEGGTPGLGGQSRRLHRRQRAEARRRVEGRRRPGVARHQQPAATRPSS